jgi:3-phytase
MLIGSCQRPSGPELVSIPAVFQTPHDESVNIDSPAVWHGPDGQHWLLATAKSTDEIYVYDAADGSLIMKTGGTGNAPGRFRRPNGIAVFNHVLLVVERDNHRVQVLTLPGLKPLGSFAERTLRPYGIALYAEDANTVIAAVTDNYETDTGEIPSLEALGKRVHQYRITLHQEGFEASLVRVFGDTTEPGALKKVETIAADPANSRYLIAEELSAEKNIKLYSFEGKFTGTIMGSGEFRYEPEGIAYMQNPAGRGYWFVTDQDLKTNRFLVYDAKTLTLVAAFTCPDVRNTDGVALSQRSFGPFSLGAFYAVHNDGSVAAMDLGLIIDKLAL